MADAYPFDSTGLAPSNKIAAEVQTLTEINSNAYRIIIPKFSPFYVDNLVVNYIDSSNNINVLIEGVDFHLTLPYIGASRSIGKMVYGAISISNLKFNGEYRVSYQTIGGKWTCNVSQIFNNLMNLNYNARTTTWDAVSNVPDIFPAINHSVNMNDLKGQEHLIASIEQLATTILNKPASIFPLPATQGQVNEGISNTSFVTPFTLKNATGIGGNNGAPAVHNHEISEVNGLQTILNTKEQIGHSHNLSNITGLQDVLNNKSNNNHIHTFIEVPGLQTSLDGLSSRIDAIGAASGGSVITGITDVPGLVSALNSKSGLGHSHSIGDIGDLTNRLDVIEAQLASKASSSHSHSISEITDLQNQLSSIQVELNTIKTNIASGSSGNSGSFNAPSRWSNLEPGIATGSVIGTLIDTTGDYNEYFDDSSLSGWILSQATSTIDGMPYSEGAKLKTDPEGYLIFDTIAYNDSRPVQEYVLTNIPYSSIYNNLHYTGAKLTRKYSKPIYDFSFEISNIGYFDNNIGILSNTPRDLCGNTFTNKFNNSSIYVPYASGKETIDNPNNYKYIDAITNIYNYNSNNGGSASPQFNYLEIHRITIGNDLKPDLFRMTYIVENILSTGTTSSLPGLNTGSPYQITAKYYSNYFKMRGGYGANGLEAREPRYSRDKIRIDRATSSSSKIFVNNGANNQIMYLCEAANAGSAPVNSFSYEIITTINPNFDVYAQMPRDEYLKRLKNIKVGGIKLTAMSGQNIPTSIDANAYNVSPEYRYQILTS